MGAIDAMQDGDCLYASYRDHGTALAVGSPPGGRDGGAVRQGDGRRPRPRRLDAPAGRAAPLLRRLGHRRRAPADRRRHGAGAQLQRPPPRRAVPVRRRRGRDRVVSRGAQPGRRVGPADRLPDHQQPVRHGHLGRAVGGRARPVAAGGRLPHARRTGGRKRRAGGARGDRAAAGRGPRAASPRPAGDGHLPLPRPQRCRRRQGLPQRRGDRELAQARPDHPLRPALHRARAADGGADRADLDATSRPRSRTRSTRRWPPPSPTPTRSTSTSTATPPGASSSRACGPARRSASAARSAHGRPDLPRGAAPGAGRGARARRGRVSDGRGDRPLRGQLQGHRRPVGEVRRAARARDADLGGGLHRRRHRRGHDGPAARDRDHDDQLHPGGDGPGHQPRGQDPLHVRRHRRRAAGDPRPRRRRRPADRPALAEPRGLVRRLPGAEGGRAGLGGRRLRHAEDRHPRRRPGAVLREPGHVQRHRPAPRRPRAHPCRWAGRRSSARAPT